MRKRLLIAASAAAVLTAGLAPNATSQAGSKESDVSALVKGNNEFAFDLYGRLRGRDGNLFFSPESISTALAMTYAGARGETADEMAKALHLTLPPDRLHPAFADLIKQLNGDGKKRGYQLSVANALWGQKGHAFKSEFVTLTRSDYGGGLREVDFVHNAEGARKQINAWVEQQTQDRIRNLLGPGTVGADTRLLLTNAVYFKGDWLRRFDKDHTRDEPFLTGGEKVTAPLMHQTARFPYHDAGAVRVLELPYAGKDLSMVVLLPVRADGLAELEKSLTAERLAGWVGKLHEQEVVVSLPRFKTTAEFRLNEPLGALGMKKAFRGGDFSGISGEEGLVLGDVVHKALVEVNEEGTEAAAATGVVSRQVAFREKQVFRADHPFVFLIRDERNGSVLFLGRVVNPLK